MIPQNSDERAITVQMLSKSQEGYIRSLSTTDIVRVHPFDPRTREVADTLMATIAQKLPTARIIHNGSSALGIAGENDIDLGVIAEPFDTSTQALEEIFGPAQQFREREQIKHWEFVRDGFKVELYLSSSISEEIQEEIDTFEYFQSTPEALAKYEQLKISLDGLPVQEYHRRKKEFFNELPFIAGKYQKKSS